MILDINRLMLKVHLGCRPAERHEAQDVSVNVSILFENEVRALETDELADTICYQDICNKIKTVAAAKEFKTVEHLAFEIRRALKPLLGDSARADLAVHKLRPPIEGLMDGVTVRLRV